MLFDITHNTVACKIYNFIHKTQCQFTYFVTIVVLFIFIKSKMFHPSFATKKMKNERNLNKYITANHIHLTRDSLLPIGIIDRTELKAYKRSFE